MNPNWNGTVPTEKLNIATSYLYHLGVQIPMDLNSLFRINFAAQFIDINNMLHSWHKKFLFWPDQIHIIKKIIFPEFFLFRTLPILIVPSDFSQHGIMMDFLWSYHKHRIKISMLTRPLKVGGLGLLDLQVY